LRLFFSFLFLTLILILPAPPARAAEPVEVVIRGVEEEMLDNVRVALGLPPGLVREGTVNRRWLKRFARQVPKKVGPALEPFGYFAADAEVALEELEKNRFRLTVEVDPGEPVRVRLVRFELVGPGEEASSLRDMVKDFPLREGAVLRQDRYEKAKGSLKARALDLGYLAAGFPTHEILVHRGEGWADIDLVLETGPRYLFGHALLLGAEDYPKGFLRRFLAFSPGEVFSHARLGQTQLNFLDTDRFREVLITPRIEAAEDQRVSVEIHLAPSPRRRLRPGIGYGTDTGARLSLEYRDLNVFHRAHLLEGDLLMAELRQSLTSSYTIPWGRNIQTATVLRLGYNREDIDTYETQSIFAEGEVVRDYGKGRRGSVFLRLLQEDSTIADDDFRSRMVIPGIRYSRRRYPDTVRPKEGYHFRIEVRGGHQSLGSDTGLVQTLVSGNALLPLPGRLSLFARMDGGLTLQNEALEEFPVSLRFFAGGDQSVRGYAYQSLAPSDSDGEVVGGKHVLVGSLELERALGENWGGALFYDIGNAFDSLSEYELAQGAGIGIRRYTPVGPVRIDLARQVGQKDPSYRLHLSVGFGW